MDDLERSRDTPEGRAEIAARISHLTTYGGYVHRNFRPLIISYDPNVQARALSIYSVDLVGFKEAILGHSAMLPRDPDTSSHNPLTKRTT